MFKARLGSKCSICALNTIQIAITVQDKYDSITVSKIVEKLHLNRKVASSTLICQLYFLRSYK